jgi:transposase-like protein
VNTSVVVESLGRRRRRRHSAEFKASVIQACQQPGVSIAAVALANGLNANLLRRWVAEAEQASGGMPSSEPPAVAQRDGGSTAAFVPLALPASSAATDIRIELQRAGTVINVTWPASAAAECAAWLRELLR